MKVIPVMSARFTVFHASVGHAQPSQQGAAVNCAVDVGRAPVHATSWLSRGDQENVKAELHHPASW